MVSRGFVVRRCGGQIQGDGSDMGCMNCRKRGPHNETPGTTSISTMDGRIAPAPRAGVDNPRAAIFGGYVAGLLASLDLWMWWR